MCSPRTGRCRRPVGRHSCDGRLVVARLTNACNSACTILGWKLVELTRPRCDAVFWVCFSDAVAAVAAVLQRVAKHVDGHNKRKWLPACLRQRAKVGTLHLTRMSSERQLASGATATASRCLPWATSSVTRTARPYTSSLKLQEAHPDLPTSQVATTYTSESHACHCCRRQHRRGGTVCGRAHSNSTVEPLLSGLSPQSPSLARPCSQCLGRMRKGLHPVDRTSSHSLPRSEEGEAKRPRRAATDRQSRKSRQRAGARTAAACSMYTRSAHGTAP